MLAVLTSWLYRLPRQELARVSGMQLDTRQE